MRITIAERLKPFTQTPGTYLPIPGSSLRLQVFPTHLRFDDLYSPIPVPFFECGLLLRGPVKQFTAQLDLEKGCILLWGHYQEGFVRMRISALQEGRGVRITLLRCPEEGIGFSCLPSPIHTNEQFVIYSDRVTKTTVPVFQPPETDRLSLGSHKKQDWDLVRRRRDLREIFPHWLRLGQLMTPFHAEQNVGTLALLKHCKESDKLSVYEDFQNLFLAGFEGILSPRLTDTEFQGLCTPPQEETLRVSPLALLSEGADLIRHLFVKQEDQSLSLLPCLPPEFHSGRFTSINCFPIGILDIEWSKKLIRRMRLLASTTGTIKLHFQKSIRRYRMRTHFQGRGEYYDVNSTQNIDSGKIYYFDNFQK